MWTGRVYLPSFVASEGSGCLVLFVRVDSGIMGLGRLQSLLLVSELM